MGRASRPRGSAKVIAHADSVEIERPRPAGITLSRGTEVPQTARGRRTKLNVLHIKGAYNGIKPQPSAPELDQRQARPREKQSLNLFRRGKALLAVVTFIGSREHVIEIGRGFLGILVLTPERRRPAKGRIRVGASLWPAQHTRAPGRTVLRVFELRVSVLPPARGYPEVFRAAQ